DAGNRAQPGDRLRQGFQGRALRPGSRPDTQRGRAAARCRRRGGIRSHCRSPQNGQTLCRCKLNDRSLNPVPKEESPIATTTAVRDKRTPETTNSEKESPVVANSVDGKRGIDLLHDPVLNKATAYTEAERQALGLVGQVPDATESEDLQLRRVLQQLEHKTTDLERYIYLISLLDNDETLFYRTLVSDPARFLPIVYDPTIGYACLKFGHIYRRAPR